MKKILFIFLVLVFAVVSCNKEDETIILEREIERVMQHDTVRVVDVDTVLIRDLQLIRDTIIVRDTVKVVTGLQEMTWFDIMRICDYYVRIGENCSDVAAYEEYVDSHVCEPVHMYLVWFAFADKREFHRWTDYTIVDDDENVLPNNYKILKNFEQDVVTPARKYVKSLEEQGYGPSEHPSWLEPEVFISQAMKDYQGNNPYAFLLFATEMARHEFLFGI